jgi:hypothetical protein
MKSRLLTILTVVLIGILLVLLQSCKEKKDDAPNESEIFIGRLSAAWKTSRVTTDGVDVTGAFKNMTITFSADKTYSVTNAVSPIWPANGSFELIQVNENQFNIKRSDGMTIDVTSLSDSKMVLELFYTSNAGRASGVTGHYKFELNR